MYYTYVHVVRLTYTESTSEIMCNKNKNIKTHQKPHNWLPLKEKINVIQDIENGCRPLDVADKYKITRSTVCFIKKRKETIMKCVNSGVECNSKQRKSTKGAHDQQLDEAVYKWFCQAKQLGQPISGPMICEKAVLFKKQISNNCDQDFKASSGWLTRFKKRHGIRERTQQGEKLSADFNGGIHYCFEFQNLLGENRFSLEFVFNADESGLNWKSLPDKTLACNYERDCPGRKKNKERITMLLCANASGSFRLPLFVVGKFRSPRCLHNVTTLPVVYRAQKSAWMDATLFLEWYKDCFITSVKRMQAETGQYGKVLLLLDNARVHPSKEILDAVNEDFSVEFLPPNVTSPIQPMDQGIIEKVKKMYRKSLLTKLLVRNNDSISVEAFLKSFTLKDCCQSLSEAFECLTQENLKAGWNKLLGRCDVTTENTIDDDLTLSLQSFRKMVNGVKDLSPDYELPIESIENPMATNSEVCQIKSSENSTDNEISNFSQTYELQSKKEFFKTGSFSTCRKCRHKETLKDYAVKIIPKEYNSFYEELYLFKKCQSHPNVVKLIESFQEREKNYFVMELLTGGNLYDVVVTSFTEERSKKLLQQLASAVSFLHSKDVVHRDIKPENLVFVHSGEESPIKIIDFGFSLEEDECKPLKSPFFSLPYSAPEIVALEKYDERSDLWSLGSILYYMLTREQAFPITYSIDAALSIKSGKTKLSEEIIDHASDDCKDVIRRLLQVDPRKRLSATSLLSHSWFINENCDTIVDFQR